ncbi:MAG: glycoside hydrolase family 15 protein [Candidatus Dormiibacterota bacterium]
MGPEPSPVDLVAALDRPVKEYFCLADGRTAALVHSEGRCDFWCWPQFDSPLRLAALLDAGRGGSVGVNAARGSRRSVSWAGQSRVILFAFPNGLQIQCGLLDDGTGSSALVWLVDGPSGELIDISLSAPSAGSGARWGATRFGAELGHGALPDGPGGPLALTVSAPAELSSGGLVAELPPHGMVIWLGAPGERGELPLRLAMTAEAPRNAIAQSRELLSEAIVEDRTWLENLHQSPALGHLLGNGPVWAVNAVDRSLLTLRGLQEKESGLLVASPVTSIPQWPGSERAWDYRYAWLRDCADAGIALCHAGAFPESAAVARRLAAMLGERPDLTPPVRRISGGELPPEHTLSQLRGYSGALVRIGNGAAGQVQLDTLGEVTRLALELDLMDHCPDELLRRVPALADAAARWWRLPDHGIWEVRGIPHDYVHSKVMAWSALRSAILLAERGRVAGWVTAWQEEATAIRREVVSKGRGPGGELVMSFQDSTADSALLAAYLVSFIRPNEPAAESTLRRVSRELGRGPLMARHSPERDGLAAPCFPFIFPGVWAATSEALLGHLSAAEARLLAICQLAGPSGQLSEVADPGTGALWGNYPQVQSHAALIDAALTIWQPDRTEAPWGDQ